MIPPPASMVRHMMDCAPFYIKLHCSKLLLFRVVFHTAFCVQWHEQDFSDKVFFCMGVNVMGVKPYFGRFQD